MRRAYSANATWFLAEALSRFGGDGMEGSCSIWGLMGASGRSSLRLGLKPEFGRATSSFTISTEARAAIHSVLGFDVSADGHRFCNRDVSDRPVIVVIQNWEALLSTIH